MIALRVITFFLYDRHPLLGLVTRKLFVPILVGFSIARGLDYLPEWVSVAFVIAANVVAALLVYLIIFRKRR